MPTRSLVGYKTRTDHGIGCIKYIYVHYDGYPEDMLPKLENYNSFSKVCDLVRLGNLESLGSNIEGCFRFKEDGGTVYSLINDSFVSRARFNRCDFCYVFDNDEWNWFKVN